MHHVPELYLMPQALSRARMPGSRDRVSRPARQVAAEARHTYARQLGSR